ncbi:hypothetical protein [Vibrio aerogenes]|uniref:hypothetical protein n=1 Tax=Vibrio aerogenes TaxID=92172 RepID=UPI0039F0BD6B
MGLTTKEILQEYYVTGACIMSPYYFCLLLEQDEDSKDDPDEDGVKVRFAVHNLKNDPGKRWGKVQFDEGWASPSIVHTDKLNEYLVADRGGDVYYCGVGDNKQFEKSIEDSAGIWSLKNINGNIYGATIPRITYKRLGVNRWEELCDLSKLPGAQHSNRVGFYALDGFTEQDIYAIGGDRDVWHFDGKDWSPVDIGRETFICSCIVCADDGYVYIAGRSGIIARGRGDEWETHYPKKPSDNIWSITSYRGRVFAGTESETLIIGDDLIPRTYDFEGQLPSIAGRYMYSAYDRLLITNNDNQIAFFNGEKWLDINGCFDITEEEAQVLMSQNLEWIEQAQDDLEDLMDIINKVKK